MPGGDPAADTGGVMDGDGRDAPETDGDPSAGGEAFLIASATWS